MRIKIESSFKESILNANNSIYEVFIFCGFCAHCIQKTIKSFFLKIEFCLRDERKNILPRDKKTKMRTLKSFYSHEGLGKPRIA